MTLVKNSQMKGMELPIVDDPLLRALLTLAERIYTSNESPYYELSSTIASHYTDRTVRQWVWYGKTIVPLLVFSFGFYLAIRIPTPGILQSARIRRLVFATLELFCAAWVMVVILSMLTEIRTRDESSLAWCELHASSSLLKDYCKDESKEKALNYFACWAFVVIQIVVLVKFAIWLAMTLVSAANVVIESMRCQEFLVRIVNWLSAHDHSVSLLLRVLFLWLLFVSFLFQCWSQSRLVSSVASKEMLSSVCQHALFKSQVESTHTHLLCSDQLAKSGSSVAHWVLFVLMVIASWVLHLLSCLVIWFMGDVITSGIRSVRAQELDQMKHLLVKQTLKGSDPNYNRGDFPRELYDLIRGYDN